MSFYLDVRAGPKDKAVYGGDLGRTSIAGVVSRLLASKLGLRRPQAIQPEGGSSDVLLDLLRTTRPACWRKAWLAYF
jgi:hypothetical protein